MTELLPNKEQARKLAVSLAVFWACWGVAVSGAGVGVPAAAGLAAVVGLVFGFRFYFVLFQVWEPDTGESAWRMMFVPSFSRRRLSGHLFDLFRPSWIRQSLRATGWNPKLVGYGLLALLVADLAVALVVFPHLPSR